MHSEVIQQLFHETAARYPTNVALALADGTVTYAQLEERSNRLANYLLAAGVAQGTIIAILVDNRATIITAMLGILKAGCAFCPLDTAFPEKRLALMLAQVEPTWFITEANHLSKVAALAQALPATQTHVICMDEGTVDGVASHLTLHTAYQTYTETSYPALAVDPDALCSIYFTSGSTGIPKAIAGRLKGIGHYALWESALLEVGPGTRFSQLFSPAFDGFHMDVFVPLCAGGTVCIPAAPDLVLQTPALIQWLDQEAITVLQCVPAIVRTILNEAPAPTLFPALRVVGTTGEAILPADVGRWHAIFGERIQLVNLYGPTETTVTKFVYRIQARDAQLSTIPIGQPMPGTDAILVDEQGQVVPPGEIGEILIRTPYRALGYYKQPALTQAVFIANPQTNDPQDIVYKTGDLGYRMANGDYGFVGRKDNQLKIRGVRIELGEIESRLYEHPAVREVAVVGYMDAQDFTALCAYVVPQPLAGEAACNAETLIAQLRAYLADHLPDAMVPSTFILLDDLPRTVTGKIDRRALPSVQQAQAVRSVVTTAPRTPVETHLAHIWGELLKAPQLDVFDDFFAIGGHSLLGAQVLTRVRHDFQVNISLRQFFEAPTIAGLGQQIETLLWATAHANGGTPSAHPVADREEGVL